MSITDHDEKRLAPHSRGKYAPAVEPTAAPMAITVLGFICLLYTPKRASSACYYFGMNEFMRRKGVATVSYIVAVISTLAVFALIIAEAYVRWNLNKDFDFLGGEALAAWIVSTFGLWIALLFAARKGE